LREANPSFQYILFTNLDDLPAIGWKKVVMPDLQKSLNVNRTITQSRWAKFLPWKHNETLESCPVIFFTDGYTRPKNSYNVSALFRQAAKSIKAHEFGLAQYPKTGATIEQWGRYIVADRKDSKSNVRRTIKWMEKQDDYILRKNKQIVYLNRHIGIDPHNPNFQRLSQYFWDEYSKEEGTFRDQLLWAYAVDKFGAKPLNLNEIAGSKDTLFEKLVENMGYNGHYYVNKKGHQVVNISATN